MGLTERKPPTHKLHIEVPINMDDPPTDFDAVKQALELALSVSTAAYKKVICDDIEVTLEECIDGEG